MKCQACGANVPGGSRFCNRCGAPAVPYAVPPGQYPGQIPYAPYPLPAKKDDDKTVLVLVVLIIVAVIVLPIILAGVLYFMVLGFGEEYTSTPVTMLARSPFAGGVKFTFGPPTDDVTWNDVSMILSDGLNSVSWHDPTAIDLTSSGGAVTWHCDYPKQLTPIVIWLNITDIAGNGMINAGDFFTFTTGSSQTFSISVTYTVTIVFEPTGGMMTSASFASPLTILGNI